MRSASSSGTVALAALTILAACGGETPVQPAGPDVAAADVVGRDGFGWSEPVWLGPVVNSTARDWEPTVSPDGLHLYFHSDRSGGVGGMDIWVSRRTHPNAPWEQPVNLGAPINTAAGDGDATFTADGRTMFFMSQGHGGYGSQDIFVSFRADPNDDFGWQPPINLGPDVNTAAGEATPSYVENEDGGTLYFTRVSTGSPTSSDVYKARVSRTGETFGPAVLVPELSLPGIADGALTVRADGRELIFWSGGAAALRPGTVGLADLWVSTRHSVNDAWSTPRNLGLPVNTIFAELSATLSPDGRTLHFTSNRPGGLGQNDLWMTTRLAPRP
jgi:hypothetical protein